MNNLGLAEEEVSELFYGNNIFKDKECEKLKYKFVKKTFVYADSEKSAVDYLVTIQEVSTGDYFQARLGESPWYMQNEHNANQIWRKVNPKTKQEVEYE